MLTTYKISSVEIEPASVVKRINSLLRFVPGALEQPEIARLEIECTAQDGTALGFIKIDHDSGTVFLES